MIDTNTRGILKLIQRSNDTGEGWRNVSALLTPLVRQMSASEPSLFEIKDTDSGESKIRLTDKGNMVLEYL